MLCEILILVSRKFMGCAFYLSNRVYANYFVGISCILCSFVNTERFHYFVYFSSFNELDLRHVIKTILIS